jgi:hypothetical protein
MVLFINTFITNKRFSQTSKVMSDDARYSPNRDDVFKYMLSSLSVIDWEYVVIYYELDDEYANQYDEIDSYINKLFSCDKQIYHYRNHNQSMWKDSVLRLNEFSDNQLIWFSCDDDHIFIDSSLSCLEHIIEQQQKMLEFSPYVTCYLSHWPEMLALRINSGKFTRKIIEDNKRYFVMDWKNADGISIINKGLLKYWWFENDYGERTFRRTDDPENDVVSPEIKTIVPYRELVRHFDGYGHVGINPNECPPLFIPDGFFESQVKISSLKKPHSSGYVYLDVKNKKSKAFSKSGADIRCLSNEVPLFWKAKIVEKINEYENNSKILNYRNRAILQLACSDKRGGFSPARAVSFLKQSYFKDQNLLLVLVDSLWVWKINDFRLHFTNVFKRKLPRVFNIIYKAYSKVNK